MKIFCDAGSFPVVLQSDNAAEFVGEILKHLNRMLEIKHITGSSYHPQSQGAVESIHKTLNMYVRALVDGEPERWEEFLPFAAMILRSAPMACLGGRSPYEVVTGLKPRFPQSLRSGIPVALETVDKYVADLVEHLKEVHASVQRVALQSVEREEESLGGKLSAELEVGDPVLLRRPKTVEREGPTRFQERTYPGIYKVRQKVSPTTFYIEDIVDRDAVVPSHQPIHAERLIKLDMPELELSADQPRRLEMRKSLQSPRNEYRIDRFGADGRVRLTYEAGNPEWVDLTQVEYRWLA